MGDFHVANTTVAQSLAAPAYSATWTPIITLPNLPGTIQFSNPHVLAAFYTQVGSVVSISIRMTVDVSAPGAEFSGTLLVSPPVRDISADAIVGAMTTLSQVGLFGNIDKQGNDIGVQVVNAAGALNLTGAVFQVIGSYVAE